MSAFVALICRDAPVSEALLARVAAPIAAHGPDGGADWRDDRVALSHRMLVSRAGATAGPHAGADGARIAGDIRLDARRELRDALLSAGVPAPAIHEDEALVLAAYAAWGEAMFARLAGDFAFALWDPAKRTMLLARDAFGVRPLHYAAHAGGVVASTSLPAVRAHPQVGSALDEAAIVSFLRWGFIVDSVATSFSAVRRVPPGHFVRVDAEGRVSAPIRWWTFPEPAPLRLADDREYPEGMRTVAINAVRDRMRAPRAAILMSGGVDSTGLAAAARWAEPEVALTAFTMDSSGLVRDVEPPLATLAAKALGIKQEIVADSPVPFDHLDDATMRTPQPHDHSEFSMWRRLTPRIASRAPVLLVGEDGDTLFQPPSLLRMASRWGAGFTIASLMRFMATRRRKPHTGLWLRSRVQAWFDRTGDGSLPSWVRADVARRTGDQDLPAPPAHASRPEVAAGLSSPVWQRLLEGFAPDYTGVALEASWPLLDQRVLEFALSLPPIPWCQQKEIWRAAWRGTLPDVVVDRPKTPLRGFSAAQVQKWRAAGSPRRDWDVRTAEFIDTQSASHMLQVGGVSGVVDAWRAVALDRWLRTIE